MAGIACELAGGRVVEFCRSVFGSPPAINTCPVFNSVAEGPLGVRPWTVTTQNAIRGAASLGAQLGNKHCPPGLPHTPARPPSSVPFFQVQYWSWKAKQDCRDFFRR
jgi:hypothetical protein